MGHLERLEKQQQDTVDNYRRKHRPRKRLKKKEQDLQDAKSNIEIIKKIQAI
jgi:hypothetical protein